MVDNVLTRILDAKKQHVQSCKAQTPLQEVEALAKAAPALRDFYGALKKKADAKHTGLICEIKKASPSAGLIRPDFNPAQIAKDYEAAGAACLSILTETPFFQGCDAYLKEARAATSLPVLRKDFMIDPYQVVEARAIGADCILIIMACVDDGLARELVHAAAHYGMSILFEVHDEEEFSRFDSLNLNLPNMLLGVNNRNLATLTIDLSTTEKLAALAGGRYLMVSESGIKTRENIIAIEKHEVRCFLVGESLLKQNDIGQAVKALL